MDVGAVDGQYLSSTQRTLTREGLATGSRTVPGGSFILSTRAPIGYVAQVDCETAFNQGSEGLVPTVPVDVRNFRSVELVLSGRT